MRLVYYLGRNFGDALNPIIFNELLPNLFDGEGTVDFLGIGSIIGFDILREGSKRIIFSSGFCPAYAKRPRIDESFDIFCVRGPLTAKALNLAPSLAIADGALLMREFNLRKKDKKYNFSFMPHWQSDLIYPWEKLCNELGIHYVSPATSPHKVIEDILQTEVVLAEAMHFAIVADALRVPWIPIKAYSHISDFKWNDWAASLNFRHIPNIVESLYGPLDVIEKKIKRKTDNNFPNYIYHVPSRSYDTYQDLFIKTTVVRQFKDIMKMDPRLSNDFIFNTRVNMLLDKLELVKRKYAS